ANYVCPGAIYTGMTRTNFDNPEIRAVWEKKAALRRLGQPIDIARGALLLASDEADLITGHELVVDGGLTLRAGVSIMANIHPFAASYSEARDKFLAAARVSGATTYRYDTPTKGPKGESPSTDVARLGPDDASRVVVTISSTHGVEGYCGSGFQVDWLASIGVAGLPKDTAAVFIHAINPYGFAWTRRVTEEGNDLNRNYVDHSKPYPVNEGYLEIADLLVPPDLGEAAVKAADAKLAAYRKKVGDVAYYRAVSGGQY